MVQGALRLGGLLVEQVVQDVFVALNQALRVLLSVLQLLVAVALDPLQQSCERQLLGVAQLCLLFLKNCLHLVSLC